MALSHANFTIPGTHQDFQWGERRYHEMKLQQFGNVGTVLLPGGNTERELKIPIWIHNSFASAAALSIYLNDLEDQFGAVGTLTETNGLLRSVTNVVFDDFQRSRDYLPPNPHLGWSIEGVLMFRQLRP